MVTQLDTNQKGCYTEYLFALKCMELGYNVSKPMLDASRYDLIVDNLNELLRVQIKYRTLKNDGAKNPLITISTSQYSIYKSSDVDIIAIYIVDYESWLVYRFDNKQSFRLNKKVLEKLNNFDALSFHS